MQSFQENVLNPVRAYIGSNNIQVPGLGSQNLKWSFAMGPRQISQIRLEAEVSDLASDFQKDRAAAPSFLVSLAFWLQKATRQPIEARLRIVGEPPLTGRGLLHWRRNAFISTEYEKIMPGFFKCQPTIEWEWPSNPIMNIPGKRTTQISENGEEHKLEGLIAKNGQILSDFNSNVAPLVAFNRQFPVGLFDQKVEEGYRWTPGGGSQIDLWGSSPDGKVFHLFELKAPNAPSKMGILPEAFYYARLLHYVRVGLPNGLKIKGDWEGLEAVRSAERIVCWLLVPRVHPLLLAGGDSPLEMFNLHLEDDRMNFRILPYESLEPERISFSHEPTLA